MTNKWMTYLCFTLFVVFLVTLLYLPRNAGLKVGMRSPVTLFSPKQMQVETLQDKLISDRILQQRIMEQRPVYLRNNRLEEDSLSQMVSLMNKVRQGNAAPPLPLEVSSETLSQLRALHPADLVLLTHKIELIMRQLYADGLYRDSDRMKMIETRVREASISENVRTAVVDILVNAVKVNLMFDEEATTAQTESLKRNFIRQTTLVKKGQPILFKGDTISIVHLEILEALGLYQKHVNWMKLFVATIGVIFFMIIIERRMIYYVGTSQRQLVLMFTLEAIYVGIIYLMLIYRDRFPDFISPAYWIPVTFFTFLFSLLIYEKLSLFLSQFNAVLMLFLFAYTPQAVLFLMLMTMITNIFVQRFRKRSDLPRVGFYIAILASLLVAILEINVTQNSLNLVAVHVVQVFFTNMISIMLAMGTLPYLEQIFNITTDLKLLDYGDLNHPLMQRLLHESPGTYYHSLMVSTMAEAGAEAIGANDVLARVAAYYHDIGKLKKPEYFIENQSPDENPHDRTLPTLSALTILGHPKDGLEIARKYKLPEEIQLIISEHHGTSLLVYFYHKMLKITLHDVVQEDQFRYDCPKPSTRESAIIMCADSVEAAVRSLEKPVPSKIRAMVNKIIQDKVDDGQLVRSRLTLTDIEKIKDTFTSVILSQYHNRIKYPTREVVREESGKT